MVTKIVSGIMTSQCALLILPITCTNLSGSLEFQITRVDCNIYNILFHSLLYGGLGLNETGKFGGN